MQPAPADSLKPILLFYVFIYMNNAVYGTFVPLYFQHIGYDPAEIGTLLSLGPLVAILAQPVWGTLSDRARTKNAVLLTLLAGCVVSMILFPLSTAFGYVLIMICLFMFFQTSIYAIVDAVTLEVIDRRRSGTFSHIRMGGTFGFAAMSVLFGFLAREHIGLLFAVNGAILGICFLLTTRFPVVAGHQSHGSRMNLTALFRNRRLMTYLALNVVVQITLGYYYAFFPLYFRELGGDTALLGWSMVISSLSEVPFLLFFNRIVERVRVQVLLLGAGLAAALRWYLYTIIDEPWLALPVQALHGLIFIVLSVTMAVIINREVPNELKASGQTLNGLLSLGAARIVGSFAGGAASDAYGLRSVFAVSAAVCLACVAVFAVVFRLQGDRKDEAVR